MAVATLSEFFQTARSFTDIVSYATDSYGAVRAMALTPQVDLKAGDVITSEGKLWATGDTEAFVVVEPSTVIADGAFKKVNVLRAPNMGSLVCLKTDNLNFSSDADRDAGIAFLESQGFQTQVFYTS
ncbi:hypothetical protein NXS97_00100 [Pantoea sp. B623]|uniref:hypothetical protein n=1 Tax=Pantoea sp. B623 TaxID=2974561 RepID=UPI0021691BB6|nr:hypothetical protein [Pantoea sp. B623]MCS4492616.1 hypothetical protein [Pantoea sp. B623]